MPLPISVLVTALALADGSAERPAHRVAIEIRGPLALIEVERSISLEESPGPTPESVLDLALPAGGALAGWQVASEGVGPVRLVPAIEAAARADHARALADHGASPTRSALEEGTDYRLHFTIVGGRRATVRYRYTAPLGCRRGRFVLTVPGSLEAEPVPAEVTVTAPGGRLADLRLAGAQVRAGASGAVRGRAPARASWELSFAAAGTPAAPAALLAAVAAGKAASSLALGICASEQATLGPPPERVLLLIDRSRSVGPAGIVLERELARALVEALPPSVPFNAVFFDRKATALFSLARAATSEALAALEREVGPGQLENGTDLPVALRVAAEMLRLERARTWLVVITDGALSEEQTGPALLAAVAGLAPADTRALVLLARPRGDEPAGAAALAALRALPARFGGVLRTVDGTGVPAAAAEAVAAARGGGDLFALTVTAAEQRSVEAVGMLPRGGGETRIVSLGTARIPARAHLRHDGASLSLPLRAVPVAPAWMSPLARMDDKRLSWRAEGERLAAWVEPGPAAAAPASDDVERGRMDRGVVRNALALAYLPRARACYLGRPVHTAADRDLRGRLRLELTLERGEMLSAAVRGSTLGRPDIEACLRDTAFAIDVPRPMGSDAPVVAALNLRFQPSTRATARPDASAVDREIELIVGPASGSDPLDLLASPADGGKGQPPPGPRSPGVP
jgi:von Willebrand factor type A domain